MNTFGALEEGAAEAAFDALAAFELELHDRVVLVHGYDEFGSVVWRGLLRGEVEQLACVLHRLAGLALLHFVDVALFLGRGREGGAGGGNAFGNGWLRRAVESAARAQQVRAFGLDLAARGADGRVQSH